MVRFRWWVLVAVAACSNAPAQPNVSSEAPQPEAPSVPTIPVATKIPGKVLEVRDAKPFEVRAPKLRPLALPRGQHHRLYSAGDHVMTNVALNRYVLLDITKDRQLASFESTLRYPARGEQVIIKTGGKQGILNFATGAITTPTIHLPATEVADYTIAIDVIDPVTWVFAKGRDGKVYYGEWNRAASEVTLRETLPFMPTLIRAEGGTELGAGEFPMSAVGECARMWLVPGKPARCIPGEVVGMLFAERFKGRWLVNGTLVSDDLKQVTPIFNSCSSSFVQVVLNEELGRAISYCDSRIALTTATAHFEWKEPRGFAMSHDRSGDFEIEALADTDDGPVSRWIDLRTAMRLETPPITPIDGWAGASVSGHILGRAPGKPTELWHADLRGGFVERIATDVKCPYTLYAHATSGSRMLVDCVDLSSSRGSETTGAGTWTEVIDLAARVRYHVDQMHAGPALPSGAVGMRGTQNNRAVFALEL